MEINEVIGIFLNSWWVYLIFGMLFGSFLNVVIYRIPKGLSISVPPSACPVCKTRIKWYDNIPVLSWLILRGKCRVCKTQISIQYPLVELFVGLLTTFLYFKIGVSFYLGFMIVFSYLLFAIAVIDFKTYTIPMKMQISVLVLAVTGIVSNLFNLNIMSVDWKNSILGMISGFLLLYLIGLIGKIIYKRDDAMGGGDIILFAVSGLILGWQNILLSFFIASFIAVIAYIIPTIVNVINRKKEVNIFLDNSKELKKNYKNLEFNNELNNSGLLLQIKFNLKTNDYNSFLKEFKTNIEKNINEINEINLLRLYFRFKAVDEDVFAIKFLKKIAVDDFENTAKKVINEDLTAYNYPAENYNLLKEELKKNKISALLNILGKKDKFVESVKIPSLKELKTAYLKADNKACFLLKYNRVYQYNGYTEEQEYVAKELLNIVDLSDDDKKNNILCDMAYVYYSDRFYLQYKKTLSLLKKIKPNQDRINLYLKLALFRAVFFKQGLAFGPYLAAGILISELYGNQIISGYIDFLKHGMIKN